MYNDIGYDRSNYHIGSQWRT